MILLSAINEPLFKDDAITFGLLMGVIGIIFWATKQAPLHKFFKIVPALLLCYLIPAILSSLDIISPKYSNLWTIAKNYFLPAALILMTLSTDLKGVIKLGPKALIMFFTATIGIILGGPIAIMLTSLVSPELVGGADFDAVWRGFATLAGSWIGGGANQTAMLELYQYNPDKFGAMIAVDIVVANLWMAALLLGVGKSQKIDKWLKADSSSIENLKNQMSEYRQNTKRVTSFNGFMYIFAIAFGVVAISHVVSKGMVGVFGDMEEFKDTILASSFFWIVVVATTLGLALSFTKVRQLEGSGASRIGSVFIYMLVAIIGMKMDLSEAVNQPGLIIVGLMWMAFHVILLIIVAKIIKAPFFFLAVGSKANVGGAASAPVVASAFHPSLAPVGVLLAVLGYALGTYGAILCATLMEIVAP